MNSNSYAPVDVYNNAIELIAGILFLLQLILLLYFDNFGLNVIIFGVGWILLIPSFVLLIAPMKVLRTEDDAPENRRAINTISFAKRGIFRLLRHPLYLGWILMSIALVLISQSIFTSLCGIVIVPLVCISISRRDRYYLMKFGEEYLEYQQDVPMVNIFRGVWRYYRRNKIL
jgi:protein-S-isoprenylcysteine O-methyltransferase Ste14